MDIDQLYNESGLPELGGGDHIKHAGIFMNHYVPYNETELNNYKSNKMDGISHPKWRLTVDFHNGPGPSVSIQVKGTKIWRIISSKYNHLMRPVNFGLFSLSNVYNNTYWHKIPRWEIILEPGDVLFFPAWYWHEVHVKRGEFAASVAVRTFDIKHNFKYSITYTINLLFHSFTDIIASKIFGKKRDFIDIVIKKYQKTQN